MVSRSGIVPAFLAFALVLLVASTSHARQGKKSKADLDVPKSPPIKSLKDGKFVKPPASATPTSYFYAISSKGEVIGQGKTITYRGNQMKLKKVREGIEISLDDDDWELEIAPPEKGKLKVGEYTGAKRYAFNDDAPGLNFSGMGRGANDIAGKFVIWELETKGETVTKLAVDFYQLSEGKGPPLYGALRFNSSLK